MNLVVFDIGGTTVKHGVWEKQKLRDVSAFPTPATFRELVKQLQQVIIEYDQSFDGIAISAPGAVDQEQRRILGISAVEYIHQRSIFDELEQHLGLPVSIENDANCAGIAEVELGVGKDAQNIAFVVLGTGAGGALFVQRRLYKGSHLFGGEVGLLKSQQSETFSQTGTLVKAANFYSAQSHRSVDGKELLALKTQGDPLAAKLINEIYQIMANNLYTIQVVFDPELIVLGGGISQRPELAEELSERLLEQLENEGIAEAMPTVKCCKFNNDANLIGAALNFETNFFLKNEKRNR